MSKIDSHFAEEQQIRWVEDSQQLKGSKKRGRRSLKRLTELGTDVDDRDTGATGSPSDNGQPLSDEDDPDARGKAEMRKFQRKLASKFAEQGDRRIFSTELDDVLGESPSENDEDDEDEMLEDIARPKKRSRGSGANRGRGRGAGLSNSSISCAPRPKRKLRKSKLASYMIEDSELDPEAVAAAIAAGVDITDGVSYRKEQTGFG